MENIDQKNNHKSSSNQDFSLIGVYDLLRISLLTFQQIWKSLVVIWFFPVFVGGLILVLFIYAVDAAIAALGLPDIFSFIVFFAALSLWGVVSASWVSVSLIIVLKEEKEEINEREILKKGFSKIISFTWITILLTLIVAGGLMLGIIPGIIFYVRFGFAPFVLIFEDIKGLDALFRSKQLVSGKWKEVFSRLFPIIAIPIVIDFLIIFIFRTTIPFFSALLGMIVLIYNFIIYEDLKIIKNEISFQLPSRGEKRKYALIAVIGIMFIIGALFAFEGLNDRRLGEKYSKPLQRLIESQNQMQQSLLIENKIFSLRKIILSIGSEEGYAGINCSRPELSSTCNEIESLTNNKLVINSSEEEFCAYIKLPAEGYICTDAHGSSFVGFTLVFPGEDEYCNEKNFFCPGTEEIIKKLAKERMKEEKLWKIYKNEKYRFEFKYPAIYDTDEYRHCKLNQKGNNFYLGNCCLLRVESLGESTLSAYATKWINQHYQDPSYIFWKKESQQSYLFKERSINKISYVYGTKEISETYGNIIFVQDNQEVYEFIYDKGFLKKGDGECDFRFEDEYFSEGDVYKKMFNTFNFLE